MLGAWADRSVFLTGHTGFKGSWLALWLVKAGARVTGYSLAPPTSPSLFEAARIRELVHHIDGDVRDLVSLERAIDRARPEVIFHLAAQSLVRESYISPVDTYATNVMGTVHVLDAVRRVPSVRVVVCVTSDKCYENREWVWPYREIDPMGGHDPYSNSKGCAELVISAYRRTFFQTHGAGTAAVASVRAGNVIGGGDWATDRLVPDIVRALEGGASPLIRSPNSLRPWQHVLDALSGYVLLAERMLAGDTQLAQGWNFGPAEDDVQPVRWIVERMLQMWGAKQGWLQSTGEQPHEALMLTLDSAKARTELGWRPKMNLDSALRNVVEWHRAAAKAEDPRLICLEQIARYVAADRGAMGT
jgi:CDP-glucose 4,6-dehydratase